MFINRSFLIVFVSCAMLVLPNALSGAHIACAYSASNEPDFTVGSKHNNVRGMLQYMAYSVECALVRCAAENAGAVGYKLEKKGSAEVLLKNGVLTTAIKNAGGSTVSTFKTKRNHYICDFLLADIDDDGNPELLMSLWKRGSFGRDRPSWVDEHVQSDDEISSHFFIYAMRGGAWHAIWCSSEVKPPISKIAACVVEEHGKIREAVTITRSNGSSVVWVWRGWGIKAL